MESHVNSVDTSLEITINKKKRAELDQSMEDVCPPPDEVSRNVSKKKFIPKMKITGPITKKDWAKTTESRRTPIQSRLYISGHPFQATKRSSTPLHRQLPRSVTGQTQGYVTESTPQSTPLPCPFPSFNVPPPPIKKNSLERQLNIPPLILATKPKFTSYMIDTLCASLIQNCKSNFNIGMKEDEVKNFLQTATLDQV